MRSQDTWTFGWQSLSRYKLRTLLLLIAISIGVTSVLILTSFGEGARLFIKQEFSNLGNEMMIILPGKKETTGGSIPIYGTSARDLTINDAIALEQISSIEKVAPIIAGNSLISYQGKSREVITLGSSTDIFSVRNLNVAQGRIFKYSAKDNSTAVCVIGATIKKELFGNNQAVGEWVRFSGQKFRVIGVLEERGESLGLDMREMVIIPLKTAESLFNSPALFRILLQLNKTGSEQYTEQKIIELIKRRHDGEDDVTIISQNSLMSSLNNILTMVTASIAAIAAISLIVAGFLIMNVTYISVAKRKQEIGILKAIGASAHQVQVIFLSEALILVTIGVFIGIAFAYAFIHVVGLLWPQFPIAIPMWATLASSTLAFLIGLLFAWLPAKSAAKLDPVLALRGQ